MMRTGFIAMLMITLAVMLGGAMAYGTWGEVRANKTPDKAASRLAKVDSARASNREMLSAAEAAAAQKSGLLPAAAQSLLKTEGRMRHGDYHWDEAGVPPGPLTIWVDLRTQLISIFRGGHEIGTAVIVYGAETMQSPLGSFPILSKHQDYHSRSYDAPMPYSLFITNTGVALHGSPMSSRRATHGCVGLPVEFARLVFGAARVGDKVHIVRSAPGPRP